MKANWPADKVERRPIDALIPYANNARTHSDEQVAQIAASMKEWGWTNPVLIDETGMIIAGHGRVLAARKLGLDEVPVMVADGWTDAQKKAYVLADNQLALNAGWDAELLSTELKGLDELGFDLGLLGFGDLDTLLADKTEGLTDPDEVPDAPVNPVTVLGDVWLLGKHRVMCGDSTDITSVANLMDGASADLVFTSPPYAQQRDYGAAKEKVSDWDALMQGVFSALPAHNATQVLVNLGLVHRDNEWIPYWDGWIAWMREQGWRRFGWYVWDQGHGLPGDWGGRLAPSHEFIFHFNRVSPRPNKTKEKKPENIKDTTGSAGLRKRDGTIGKLANGAASLATHKVPDSVVRVGRHHGAVPGGQHPAVFSVAFAQEIIEAYSDEGESVYEPFAGSGTSIVAAERTGRSCFAMELDPAYVDVAVRRWQAFTGKEATLEGDGRTFAEIDAGRAVTKAA